MLGLSAHWNQSVNQLQPASIAELLPNALWHFCFMQLQSLLQLLSRPPYWSPRFKPLHMFPLELHAFIAPTPPPGINRSNWPAERPPILITWTIIDLPLAAPPVKSSWKHV